MKEIKKIMEKIKAIRLWFYKSGYVMKILNEVFTTIFSFLHHFKIVGNICINS